MNCAASFQFALPLNRKLETCARLTGEARDDCRSTEDMIACFHEEFSVEWQVYFRSRTEANHSEALAFFKFVADFRPCHNAPRNRAGELANHNRGARVLKSPRHCFVLLGAIGTARIEAKSL